MSLTMDGSVAPLGHRQRSMLDDENLVAGITSWPMSCSEEMHSEMMATEAGTGLSATFKGRECFTIVDWVDFEA